MEPSVLSKNNRHDTVSDVKVFLEREHPDRERTIEVVCSSARRDMDRQAKHVPYRLFCETLNLFPETRAAPGAGSVPRNWPLRTPIVCWHDCHPFDTVPLPIPKFVRLNGNTDNTYTVYGVFCSCNCAIAYILERNTYDQQQLLLRFKQMAINIFRMSSTDVFAFEPAPPRIFLTLFGGHLTIEQFRRSSLVSRSTLLTPPFISYSMVLEENARLLTGATTESAIAQLGDAANRVSLDATPPPTTRTQHGTRGLRRPPVQDATGTGTGTGTGTAAVTNTATEERVSPLPPYSVFMNTKGVTLVEGTPVDDEGSSAREHDAATLVPPGGATPAARALTKEQRRSNSRGRGGSGARGDGGTGDAHAGGESNLVPRIRYTRKKHAPASESGASATAVGTLAAFLKPVSVVPPHPG